MAGLRAGDEAAFVALLRRNQTPMLRIARTYVMNQATAEDVVQDTWLVVLNGVNRFDGRSSLKTWIYRILTNRAKTAGQRERRASPTRPPPGARSRRRRRAPRLAGSAPSGRSNGLGTGCAHRPLGCRASMMRSSPRSGGIRGGRDQSPPTRAAPRHHPPRVECWTATEVCNALELSQTNQRVLLHRARSKVRMGTAFVEPPGAA